MASLNLDQLVQQILSDLTGNYASKAEGDTLSLTHSDAASIRDIAVSGAAVFIGNKVISLADIRDNLGTTRKLFITPKAVITPSARDEIRKRRIEVAVKLEARTANNTAGGAERYIFSITDYPFLSRLEKFGKVERNVPLPKALDAVEKLSAKTVCRSVLLTVNTATALYEACRRNGIRPVLGIEILQTAEDAAELNANLIILSPKRSDETKIAELIRAA
ncbi:MAG: hypothetical protein LBT46_03785 [Planctomycetaceae bacterium]|jgi:hypothetical protein|nr:hypothetical protein [Planctomycetaceae bacterium]